MAQNTSFIPQVTIYFDLYDKHHKGSFTVEEGYLTWHKLYSYIPPGLMLFRACTSISYKDNYNVLEIEGGIPGRDHIVGSIKVPSLMFSSEIKHNMLYVLKNGKFYMLNNSEIKKIIDNAMAISSAEQKMIQAISDYNDAKHRVENEIINKHFILRFLKNNL